MKMRLFGVQAADIGDDVGEVYIRQGEASAPRGHGYTCRIQWISYRTTRLDERQEFSIRVAVEEHAANERFA